MPEAASSKEDGVPEVELDWRKCIPKGVGHLCCVNDEAVWVLSSCKVEGFGIEQLLDDRTDLYWQSDGVLPHYLTVEFQRKTAVSFICIFLDTKTDESYTPERIQIQTGSSILDLDEPITVDFNGPVGWQAIDLRENGKPTQTFVVVVKILQNHQNGRDTHVRGIKLLGAAMQCDKDNLLLR